MDTVVRIKMVSLLRVKTQNVEALEKNSDMSD